MTAAARSPQGIALNGASANQPISVQRGGSITIGATLTAGTAYYLSGTAGGIAPEADLASLDELTLLFVATSTTKAWLRPWNTGVTI